ncbi:MAG TPA: hypothetical protein VJ833_01895 [Rhodanobacteraceae bacterium]|nr:hypothetical protein [Rhodanobacteraceae bacterium]
MNSWIDTTQSLPVEHEYVRFLVVGHTRALMGVYEKQGFCSRWGTYDKAQVGIWRKLGDAPQVPPPARTNAEQHSWSDRPMREGC